MFGVARLIQICLPFMKENSQVINISSIGGVQGSVKFPGLSAYSSSKGALITLTEMLAEEYKELKINFNVLALGAVQTEMLEEAFPGYKASVSSKEMADYIYDFSIKGSNYKWKNTSNFIQYPIVCNYIRISYQLILFLTPKIYLNYIR